MYGMFFNIFFLQAFLRLSYELHLHRQSAIGRKTMEALTARCNEQNEELHKLKEERGELSCLKGNVAKCDELKSRLLRTEQWKE